MREKITVFLIYYFYRFFWGVSRKKILANKKKRVQPKILFGATPIISFKYWSASLSAAGYDSHTLSYGVPSINTKSDFDFQVDELFPITGRVTNWKRTVRQLKLLTYVVTNYDIVFMSYRFHFIDETLFWRKEAHILSYFGLKTIIVPYGSDYYMYSKVIDHSVKHNLLVNVYQENFNEEKILERVTYWKKHADFIIQALMIDGAQRWDAIPFNSVIINTHQWKTKSRYNMNDGKNGAVKIVHAPNHRGFKGTEYIIKAVEDLKQEGFLIDLILIENKPNTEVQRILHEEADILVEQIIIGYALSAIEGMASGVPVISNLERQDITQVFRRYSYLNECPIVSASPENIKENLLQLITNPELRVQLGKAGRQFTEKYHSLEFGQFLFGKIIDKIWYKKKVDSLNLFHPLNPNSYNNQSPKIIHPLKENKLPRLEKDPGN